MNTKSAIKTGPSTPTLTEEVKKRLFRFFRPEEEIINVKVKQSKSLEDSKHLANRPNFGNHNSMDGIIEAMKEQLEIAIRKMDKDAIDTMTIGQTKIQKEKSVILSWTTDQSLPAAIWPDEDEEVENEDGILLYVAIKMKKDSNNEKSIKMG